MTTFRFSSVAAAAALLLQSCAPGQDAPTPSSTLDLSHYLAVGDSYTAGISNGGLSRNSQLYSYPNLLAQSFQQVSPAATFTQPLLDAGTATSRLTLVSYNGVDLPVLRRVPGMGVGSPYITAPSCGPADTLDRLPRSTTAGTPPQNLGVPGMRLALTVATGLGNEANATPSGPFNPYFERLLPPADNSSYLQTVTTAAASASFFTYFQGFDDFMPYLRGGGECQALLPNTTTPTLNATVKRVLDVLTTGNRRGIIVRLPSFNLLPLLSLGQGLQLEQTLRTKNNDTLSLYINSSQLGRVRPITANDYVLATAIARVGTPKVVNGITYAYGRSPQAPLERADVVEENELAIANLRRNTYNNYLETLAKNTYRMPAVDAANSQYSVRLEEDLFSQVNDQVAINGAVYSTAPVRGNFFSLDYYTLTPRGNALLANTIIKAINKAYRSNVPYVNVNSLPTNVE